MTCYFQKILGFNSFHYALRSTRVICLLVAPWLPSAVFGKRIHIFFPLLCSRDLICTQPSIVAGNCPRIWGLQLCEPGIPTGQGQTLRWSPTGASPTCLVPRAVEWEPWSLAMPAGVRRILKCTYLFFNLIISSGSIINELHT